MVVGASRSLACPPLRCVLVQVAAQSAVATVKQQKREMGVQMRRNFGRAWAQELRNKTVHAATGRSRVLSAKEAKEAKTASRYNQKRRNSVATSMLAKEERDKRKEVNGSR